MMRIGTREFEVERRDGRVVISLNEDAAAGLALALESQPRAKRGLGVDIPIHEWAEVAAQIRTAR